MPLFPLPTEAALDLSDVVADLVDTGRRWCDLRPDLTERGIRWRIEGAAYCTLALLDGDAGPGPVRLSPRTRPAVSLGGTLHEAALDPALTTDPDQQQLMRRLARVVDAHIGRPGPIEQVMGRILVAWCCVLAAHYRLWLLHTDPTGEHLVKRANLAPALPAAMAEAWAQFLAQRAVGRG